MCPFPFRRIIPEIEKFKNAEVVWVQEEPENQGPWSFVYPRFHSTLKHLKRPVDIKYVGRKESASTATGYHKLHEHELVTLLKQAIN